MVVGLVGHGVCYFLLSRADTYSAFAIILGVNGIFNPVYKVGADAMLADLIPMGKRADAFALIRMGRNIGVAAGPALGGFVLSQSYDIGLYSAALGLTLFGLAVLFFARETLPPESVGEKSNLMFQLRGYWTALKDRPFMGLVGGFTLVQMTASLVWVLLSVYVKTEYQIGEQLYGWLPTTNALMVVFLQVLITRKTKRFADHGILSLGAVFYVIAPLLIAFSTGFWGFWVAMVIMTLGELIVVPRTSALAANLAPIDKRGRYMSLYGLSWNVATGLSPLLGGFISDKVSPQAQWFGGAFFGLLAVMAFLIMSIRGSKNKQEKSGV
jgi:predicted MFS family arabinose efflux permease